MTSWDGLERRKFPRAHYPCLIVIRHNNRREPEAILTHTENLGIGGVCVILKSSIKLFTNVELELDLLDTGNNIHCEGKIVWCVQRRTSEKTKPAFFDTGIEFSRVDPNNQKRIDDVVKRLVKIGQETPYR